MRIAVIRNKYGDVVCELEEKNGIYWGVKSEDVSLFMDWLADGDEFRVEEIEVEE